MTSIDSHHGADAKSNSSSTAKAAASINPKTHPAPYNLLEWVEKNKADLKPPIGNKMIHGNGCQVLNCRNLQHEAARSARATVQSDDRRRTELPYRLPH